jgi:hypothetical protein
MNDLIIFFAVDLVLALVFLCSFKRKRITKKEFDKTEHNDVII